MGKNGTTEQDGREAGAASNDSKTGPWTALLGTAGCLAIGAGGFLAMGARLSPEAAWIAKSFGRMGIESGVLIGSGVICSALAIITQQVHRVGLKMRAAEEAVRCTHQLGQGMRLLVDRMTSLHAELSDLTDSHAAGLRLLQEQVKNQTSGMQVDATYRLAASMDQLGRQLDERLNAQEQSSDEKFSDLDRSLEESREEVRSMLEETRVHRREDLLERMSPDGTEVDLEGEPLLEEDDLFGEGELELSVELEEFPDDGTSGFDENGFDLASEDAPKIDVTKFNWDDIEIPERIKADGLGFLDEFEEAENLPGPLPSAGTTQLEWEDTPKSAMKTPAEDLGLLDELGDDGLPSSEEESEPQQPVASAEAVPSLVKDSSVLLEALAEPDLFSKEDLEEAWKAFRDSERE